MNCAQMHPVLPFDVLSIVFSFLPAKQVYQLRALSAYWRGEIDNPRGVINTVAEKRWDNHFNRLLSKTARHFTSGRLNRLPRTLLLSELHSDCSYSGLLVESMTADRAPHINDDWSPISVEPELSDEEFPTIPTFSINRKNDIYRRSESNEDRLAFQLPILREALEEHLFALFDKLSTNCGIEVTAELSPRAQQILFDRMLLKSRSSKHSFIGKQVDGRGDRTKSEVLKSGTGRKQTEDDSIELKEKNSDGMDRASWSRFYDLRVGEIFNVESRKELIIQLMGHNYDSWRNMVLPVLICHAVPVKTRDPVERDFRLKRKARWMESSYGEVFRTFIPISETIEKAIDKRIAREENPALRVVMDMFDLVDGCVELPVTFEDLQREVGEKEASLDLIEKEVVSVQLSRKMKWKSKMIKNRSKRHCAEMYIPEWTLKALKDVGKVSFIEISTFAHFEECSFYFLLSECGPYLTGLFWVNGVIDYAELVQPN